MLSINWGDFISRLHFNGYSPFTSVRGRWTWLCCLFHSFPAQVFLNLTDMAWSSGDSKGEIAKKVCKWLWASASTLDEYCADVFGCYFFQLVQNIMKLSGLSSKKSLTAQAYAYIGTGVSGFKVLGLFFSSRVLFEILLPNDTQVLQLRSTLSHASSDATPQVLGGSWGRLL